MLVQILLAVATTAALIALAMCFAYPRACKDLESHIAGKADNVREEKDAALSRAWRECGPCDMKGTKRWDLDRVRTRAFMFGLGAYAVGMAACYTLQYIGVQQHSRLFLDVLVSVYTVTIMTLGVRSVIHAQRELKLDFMRCHPDFDF